MTKVPNGKKIDKKISIPNYFKLPFEVHYSEYIPVTMLIFMSDINIKKFEDMKIIHREQGRSYGASFRCDDNRGPELYCVIKNYHDEVQPEWLYFLDEDDLNMQSGDFFSVKVEGDQINFNELNEEQCDPDSEEYLDVENMEQCYNDTFLAYEIGESCPDYIILDADESRIKVSLEGFILDDIGNETEQRIFNPEDLDEDEYEDYSRQEMYQAKFRWVESILKENFPNQMNLKLSYDSL